MKKFMVLLSVVIVIVLAIALASMVLAQGSTNSSPGSGSSQGSSGTDSNPVGTPEVIIPEEYQPKTPSAPQPTVPVTTVYFTPQDENTSDTIMFLYNTTPVTQTVGIQTFYIDGSLTVSTTVSVPASGLLRISGDTVTTVSASWSKYVLINFTTFSAYAKMTLPAGVKADGYVAWDTAGFYDPLTADQTLPLRFSTDPLTVFLPAVKR
jgi:hypothetical protein